MRTSMRFFLLLGAFALLAACGGEEPEAETIPNLAFTTADGESFTLYEDVFGNEDNKLLLMTSVAGWCQPCIQEQADLKKLHRDFGGKGLYVLAAMFETEIPKQKPTGNFVKGWVSKYELPYQMVVDGDFVLGPFFENERTPPLNMLVRAKDKKILTVTSGYDDQLIRSLIRANLE